MPKFKVVDATKPAEITIKLQMPTAEDTAQRGQQESKQLGKWDIVKEELLQTYDKDLVRVTLQKLTILEYGNKITFRGSSTFTEMMEQKFETTLQRVSAEYDLHFVFEGNCQALKQVLISEIKEEKKI
jgi:hypothetical protein